MKLWKAVGALLSRLIETDGITLGIKNDFTRCVSWAITYLVWERMPNFAIVMRQQKQA